MPNQVILITSLLCLGFSVVGAAENRRDQTRPRLVGQVLVGTSGIEPGVAAEWRLGDKFFLIRPEVFINRDAGIGFGGMVGWDLAGFPQPERQSLTFGPRVVNHNSDDQRWEADLMGIWRFDLDPAQRGRHALEGIAAVGILDEYHDHGDHHDHRDRHNHHHLEVGANIGIGYGYQF